MLRSCPPRDRSSDRSDPRFNSANVIWVESTNRRYRTVPSMLRPPTRYQTAAILPAPCAAVKCLDCTRLPHTVASLAVDWRCRHKPVFTGFARTAPIAGRRGPAAAVSVPSSREVAGDLAPNIGRQIGVRSYPTLPRRASCVPNRGSGTQHDNMKTAGAAIPMRALGRRTRLHGDCRKRKSSSAGQRITPALLGLSDHRRATA